MEDQTYPNLQVICRLCLKENAGTVCIFPKEDNSHKFVALSIPMRVMTCAALEVQENDGLPSKICTECRLQLEKSYYFRKQSQMSDAKLRKHIRLVGMGKKSKVFIKKIDEDDDDDVELEFKDTLDFIKEQEEKQKEHEQLQLDALINELKLRNEQELRDSKEALKIQCREELKPQIKKEVRNELMEEIQKQLEETMRKQIKEECLKEAKEDLLNEIRDECRQLEIKSILNDLQVFLIEKKKSIATHEILINKVAVTPSKIPLSPTANNCHSAISQCISSKSLPQVVLAQKLNKFKKENEVKDEEVNANLAEEVTEVNVNEEETETDCDANFLIYDTDDGFEVEKRSTDKSKYLDNGVAGEEEGHEFLDSNSMSYVSGDEQIGTNEESEHTSTTTSYHIEDSENGEIKFLKKSNENLLTYDGNVEQINDDNIMIINFPEVMDQDIGEYVEDYDKAVKSITLKKESSFKSNKSPDKTTKSLPALSAPLATTSTTTTLEATFLTKTYTNPLQRATDTPKIYKCDDCPMVFSTKPSLERHLRSHRKVHKTGIIHQCPECKIVVSCSSALRRHMFIHCEQKPFPCNECGKAFVQKEILKRHMVTHTGIKPYQCPHCERAFAQRINLTQHINRNHLQYPRVLQHSCHLCPKRFNHASGLSRHLAAHSGVAFQCNECDRTFSDRSSIKRHIANMHTKDRVSKGASKLKNEPDF